MFGYAWNSKVVRLRPKRQNEVIIRQLSCKHPDSVGYRDVLIPSLNTPTLVPLMAAVDEFATSTFVMPTTLARSGSIWIHLERDVREPAEGFIHVQHRPSHGLGVADEQRPSWSRRASNCAREGGGQPRSFPIFVKVCS